MSCWNVVRVLLNANVWVPKLMPSASEESLQIVNSSWPIGQFVPDEAVLCLCRQGATCPRALDPPKHEGVLHLACINTLPQGLAQTKPFNAGAKFLSSSSTISTSGHAP